MIQDKSFERYNNVKIEKYNSSVEPLVINNRIHILGSKNLKDNDIFRLNSGESYIYAEIGDSFDLSNITRNSYLYFDKQARNNFSDLKIGNGEPNFESQIVVGYYYPSARVLCSPFFHYTNNINVSFGDFANSIFKELYLNHTKDSSKVYYASYVQRNYLHANGRKYWRVDIFEADDFSGTNETLVDEFITTENVESETYIVGKQSKMYALVNWSVLTEGTSLMFIPLADCIFNKDNAPIISLIQDKNLNQQQEMSLPNSIYVRKNTVECFFPLNALSCQNSYDKILFGDGVSYSGNLKGIYDLPLKDKTYVNIDKDLVVTAKLVDNAGNVKSTKEINIKCADMSANNSTIVLHAIGDSQSRGFQYHKLQELCPNLTCIGSRDFSNFKTNKLAKTDSYPGEQMANLLNIPSLWSESSPWFFSPYLHPSGAYAKCRFLGKTNTWKSALENRYGSEYTGCWYNQAVKFNLNASTGAPQNPLKNDVMYFTEDHSFKIYDGTNWNVIEYTELNFKFNYKRFLEVWDIGTPNVVCIMMGVNDFGNGWGTNSEKFVDNLNTIVSNILQTVGLVIICTPPVYGTNSVRPQQNNPQFVWRRWLERKKIIDNFDNRESEGIYVVDSGLSVDRDNDYSKIDIANDSPTIYEPADKLLAKQEVQSNPWMDGLTFDENHPINNGEEGGYLHIAERIAAFIKWKFKAEI